MAVLSVVLSDPQCFCQYLFLYAEPEAENIPNTAYPPGPQNEAKIFIKAYSNKVHNNVGKSQDQCFLDAV